VLWKLAGPRESPGKKRFGVGRAWRCPVSGRWRLAAGPARWPGRKSTVVSTGAVGGRTAVGVYRRGWRPRVGWEALRFGG